VSSDISNDLVDTYVHAFLRPNGTFPPGPHSVEISFDEEIVGRKNFTIE
jgi:hypothetical protein